MKVSSGDISQEVTVYKQKFFWPIDSIRYHFCTDAKQRFIGSGESQLSKKELKQRVVISQQKIKHAKKYVWLWKMIPWVHMVLITGSTASLNAEEDHDIDFWVIVDERRIWLTRLCDWVLFSFFGLRRHIDTKNVKDTFCINYYKTRDNLALKKHSVAFAVQFVDAIPIFIKDYSLYLALIEQNIWIAGFFPKWFEKNRGDIMKVLKKRPHFSYKRSFLNKVVDYVEYSVGVFQIMKREKRLRVPSRLEVWTNEVNTWNEEVNRIVVKNFLDE